MTHVQTCVQYTAMNKRNETNHYYIVDFRGAFETMVNAGIPSPDINISDVIVGAGISRGAFYKYWYSPLGVTKPKRRVHSVDAGVVGRFMNFMNIPLELYGELVQLVRD